MERDRGLRSLNGLTAAKGKTGEAREKGHKGEANKGFEKGVMDKISRA
jgi:hypothetical protein